ncbi:hypothetical protein [Bacillus sp. mrc49]|uniref:hypothetical protein n=1 Tax=Bacillus sp. mrc49 TaxID=2054913 RepID=UPI000C2784B7|nr:hypothetical protein [Bacillus sp. mrc49]PJN90683.1 hypothetical protein CVN76_09200 [Bacillus sp. mrc49]
MKKLITSFFIFCLIATGVVSNATAEADNLFKTPIVKQSHQWKIEIKKGEETGEGTNNNVERYTVVITNIGEDLDEVEFNTYRNEPNTETKYGLSLNDFQHEKFKQGQVFEFQNFPMSVKANELEFELSWHGKPHSKGVHGRKYKETFIFTATK